MNMLELMEERHSVRSYIDKAIEGDVLNALTETIDECNKESGLNIQLCLNEPSAFSGMMARYGKFNNVNNYIAIIGKKSGNLEELGGYYGEKIVMKAQELGLNTCWVAMSFSKGKSKSKVRINPNEKLLMVIPIGYGTNSGVNHKVKSIEELSNVSESSPEWFRDGVKASQLAPTAMNQQKFHFELIDNDRIKANAGSGFYTKVDLGIAKYHFEVAANHKGLQWV